MKKFLFCLLIPGICFYSCKKDRPGGGDGVKPSQKLYKINVSTSGFTQTINAVPGKRTNGLKTNETVASYLKVLYYSIFDSKGNQVHYLMQDSTSANLGSITDSLPAGTYTLQIAAGKSGLLYTSQVQGRLGENALTSTNTVVYYSRQPNTPNTQPYWKDTFVGRMQLTVTGDLNQDIQLDRIVGQVEVVITDNMPANVAKISVGITSDDVIYTPSAGVPSQPAAFTVTTPVPAAAIGQPNFTTDYIVANTASPMQILINAYDATGAVIASASVPNVNCAKNQRIVLSGSLFSPSNNTFNIKLNPWGPPINVGF